MGEAIGQTLRQVLQVITTPHLDNSGKGLSADNKTNTRTLSFPPSFPTFYSIPVLPIDTRSSLIGQPSCSMDNKHQFPASHALAPANYFGSSPSLAASNYGYHGNPTPSLVAAPKSGYDGNPGSLSSQPDAYYMQRGEVGQK